MFSIFIAGCSAIALAFSSDSYTDVHLDYECSMLLTYVMCLQSKRLRTFAMVL